jgi:hypothetical protein
MVLLLRTTLGAIAPHVVYVAALAPTTLSTTASATGEIATTTTGPKAIVLKPMCQGCMEQVLLPPIRVGLYK